jgi:hypothetical protein
MGDHDASRDASVAARTGRDAALQAGVNGAAGLDALAQDRCATREGIDAGLNACTTERAKGRSLPNHFRFL